MDKKSIVSADDLCKIIKTCARNRVHVLKLENIHLVFGAEDKPTKTLETVQTKPLEKESTQISQEAEQKALRDRVSEDFEQLKLIDPLGYELILGGELEGVSSP